MSDDAEIRYESVFRGPWRDCQSAATRPGELIKPQRWIDAGLVALGVLVAGGALAAGTVSLAQTEALPAVTQGTSVAAIRGGGTPPGLGTPVRFRDASGTRQGAVVVEVTETEVRAQLE